MLPKLTPLSTSSETHVEKPEQKPFRIVAGYGGTIPTRFRNVAEKEKERLMGTDSEGLIEKITKQPLASPEDVLLFIRSSVSCERWSHLKHLPKALECFPQCTPYAVDALIKHNMLIDETIRSQLKCISRESLTKKPICQNMLK